MDDIKFLITSDTAMTVVFGSEINEETNNMVNALAKALREKPLKGVTGICPAYCSLMISYNPVLISFKKLKRKIKSLCRKLSVAGSEKKKLWEIPVCYGGAYGEDLEDTAKLLGISSDELIKRHSSVCYRIYMLGFLPGFAYLGGLDKTIAAPRLSSPRTVIPAGSVGIGGEQTGIYPMKSPGGWRLIGTTPLDVYAPERPHPILYSAGDYLKFIPVTEQEYLEIKKQVESGIYQYKCGDYYGS
ncbi:5-oxoprolinase subunit PxpB [Porcipelethomonas sp.]|uniref:5-oxoprolinase subunit PxpB n=1 Tax=Porcipelethomonas sp. TaxID=2981675 RepID=UPI003EF76DF9